MNNVIEEYLALVELVVYENDPNAFDALEKMGEEHPELPDLVYQSAGPLAYDIQNNEVTS